MAEINQNSEYGGGDIINRFAISGLSKKHNAQALPEEIMVEKNTGEFLIKSPEGMTISYDAIARRRSTITDATECALTQNMIGNMYELSIDEYMLPAIIPYGENIIGNSINLKQNLRKLLVYVDIDEIIKKDIAEVSESIPTVHLILQCIFGNETREIIVEKPINEFNNTVIDFTELVDNLPDKYSVILSHIEFNKNELNVEDTFLILHNMMITIF
jgi:hypothetical protein